ncbi:manganese-binding transcriptional regulator MntR [Spiribacter sp. 2438]|uniref:manganese-binding transcriptional regulator MntR n=1 Tax=Spiribacter sp. 2438 TaxID=2666185 RepID=UPI0012B0D8E0|nr:manganese-binding transcriptional regulator MntR [Spiribacter sp. 2438]QGM21895.1 manganese-binding transcriptional regulator MntR [Spiribacter sp. 2438]
MVERKVPLPDTETHAAQHASVRRAHETELVEDYVELIGELLDNLGEARSVDIANRMGVSKATVANMVKRLGEQGLVEAEPYRSLFLTDAGWRMARQSRTRHAVVFEFLRAMGVSESTARIDAEGIEHHVSEETLALMREYIRSIR